MPRLVPTPGSIEAAALGGQAERAGLIAHHPELLAAVAEFEAALERPSSLAPVHRGIAAVTVTRRSPYLSAFLRPIYLRQGLTDEMCSAIDHEDWTDDAFDDLEKAVFRYCLMYDAGHGIGDPVYDRVAAALPPADVIELSLVCSYWGGVARFAIAHQLQVGEEQHG